jgi:UDP-N-acetylglucosamine--N-acetylmuramyl-(pentapeptide) pyrophosphoryl-undecaprenol N-acetylglucosamine transferase
VGIKRIIISGGGTGGHIYPAIAIATALKDQDPSLEFLFVGAEGKMEMEKVPKAGFNIQGLPIVGINRQHMIKNLLFPFKLIQSLRKAFQIIAEFKPDVAIGVGGYASGPMLIAAWIKGIPFYIQEQNSFAGITNKALSSKAKHIFVAYPGMEKFFGKDKITLSGNPVRKDLIDLVGKKEKGAAFFGLDPNKKTILVIGGSQGARSINLALQDGLAAIAEADVQLIWQTGVSFEKEAKKSSESINGLKSYVSAFIYEMDLAYATADLVISRAGALSVSEICLAGKPSILVPFPNASEDHQTENAKSLVSNGAARLVVDKDAQADLVPTALMTLLNTEVLTELGLQSLAMGKPHAATEIAQAILNEMNACA